MSAFRTAFKLRKLRRTTSVQSLKRVPPFRRVPTIRRVSMSKRPSPTGGTRHVATPQMNHFFFPSQISSTSRRFAASRNVRHRPKSTSDLIHLKLEMEKTSGDRWRRAAVATQFGQRLRVFTDTLNKPVAFSTFPLPAHTAG